MPAQAIGFPRNDLLGIDPLEGWLALAQQEAARVAMI